ncbi:MAG: hypothetical protein J7K09_07430, partial [Desulfuromusa sp.]|nr:hypothetical protein [Desulfuromusa sp.]
MNKYPALSMALITFFFILMVILYVWLHPAMQEEKREEKVEVEVEVEKVTIPRVSVPEKKARFTAIIISPVNMVYTDLLQQYLDITELIQ